MQRLYDAGLEDVIAYPSFHGCELLRSYYEPLELSHLDENEKAAWQSAKAEAERNGTFYMMHPAHCAIGSRRGLRDAEAAAALGAKMPVV